MLVISEYATYARYRDPSSSPTFPKLTEDWLARHCRFSYYCFQHSKCDDLSCCLPRRSPIEQLLSGQTFLPAPRIFIHNKTKIGLADPMKLPKSYHFATLSEYFMYPVDQFLPMDMYNPKVNKRLKELRCPFCPEQYFGTVAAMKRHRIGCHKGMRYRGDIAPIETDILAENMVGAVSIEAWLKSC